MPYNEENKLMGVLIIKYLTFWRLIAFATGIWLIKIIVLWLVKIFTK